MYYRLKQPSLGEEKGGSCRSLDVLLLLAEQAIFLFVQFKLILTISLTLGKTCACGMSHYGVEVYYPPVGSRREGSTLCVPSSKSYA